MTESAIGHAVTAARFHRIHRGVYAVGHPAISRHGLCLAGVLAIPGAVLSHSSAAWLLGFETRWSPLVHATAEKAVPTRPTLRAHSSRSLTEADRIESEGIPVTATPRTLLDVAAIAPFRLANAVRRAERLGRLDLIAIDDLLRRSRGARGVARLREAMITYRDPAFTRSTLEKRFLQLVREAGLPRPSTNYFIAGYEVDAYWPPNRFAVELDTYDYHGDRMAFERDRIRQEELKLAGIEMVRITGVRLDREPAAVMKRLRTLLAMRS